MAEKTTTNPYDVTVTERIPSDSSLPHEGSVRQTSTASTSARNSHEASQPVHASSYSRSSHGYEHAPPVDLEAEDDGRVEEEEVRRSRVQAYATAISRMMGRQLVGGLKESKRVNTDDAIRQTREALNSADGTMGPGSRR